MSAAFMHLIQPFSIVLMIFGDVLGIIFGAIPGLSGGLAITLLLPLTFTMSANDAITLLAAIYVGGVSGGFISATLIGIPGTPGSVATVFDAYPMSQKGETVKALGVGIIGSFIGTFLSCLIAMFVTQYVARLALMLGPWEYFSLCICAITLVVTLSNGNMFKGLGGACIGLLLSTVGFAPVDGANRFSFGNINLSSGINMVAMMLGLFAVCQVITNYGKKQQALPDVSNIKVSGFGVSIKEILESMKTIVISFFMGLWIGFLPGMGAALSNVAAYAQAKSSSKHPEKFGTGCVEGIFASEVSNNASIGGAIIPLVALGIPGDGAGALLLSALLLQGIESGPMLLVNQPTLVYVLFIGILLSAVITLLLQFFGMRWFPKLLMIPYHYLFGAVTLICFVGAFAATNTLFNCLLMVILGIFGLLMAYIGVPVSPIILGYVLGGNIETYLRKGYSYSGGTFVEFFTRPASLIFLLIAVFSVLWNLFGSKIKAKRARKVN